MMKYLIVALALIGAVACVPSILEEGPACPIADPLEYDMGNINVTLPPILFISEESVQLGGVATGLSTLWYKYTLNLITLTINFEAGITGTACTNGDSYTADGSIDASPFTSAVFPSGDFVGTGSYHGCIQAGYVKGSATIFVNLITNRVSLSRLAVDEITFESLEITLKGLVVGGTEVDWAAWNAGIHDAFHSEWATVGSDFIEIARKAVNENILHKYTLAEFLDLIGSGSTPGTCAPEL